MRADAVLSLSALVAFLPELPTFLIVAVVFVNHLFSPYKLADIRHLTDQRPRDEP